jgi:hypothetical protein
MPLGGITPPSLSKRLDTLPPGVSVGTPSLRRHAQVRRLRPDLRVVDFCGNVETRLKKLDQGLADATLLALAGVGRLDLTAHATSILSPDEILSFLLWQKKSPPELGGDKGCLKWPMFKVPLPSLAPRRATGARR